jgi:ABC-type metal ion transport system substrate-binding protein
MLLFLILLSGNFFEIAKNDHKTTKLVVVENIKKVRFQELDKVKMKNALSGGKYKFRH